MERPRAVGLGFVSGRQVGRVVPLAGQPVLGRDPGAQVALPPEETEVSARHAQFLVSPEGRVRVVDLHSKGGTWREGERLPPGEAVPLEPGTALRFGVQGPLVLFDELAVLEGGRVELVLVREDVRGAWPVAGPVLIGRREGCQVRLDEVRDKVASGHHAHLMPAFGRAILTDLGSANGTWRVDEGRRVVQESIAPGTRFRLGKPAGPTFRLEARSGVVPAPPGTARFLAGGPAQPAPPLVVPETLCLDVEAAGGQRGRVLVLLRTRVLFGSFGGLADLPLRCFPRELEGDEQARRRGESISPAHGTLLLAPRGFELIAGQDAPTKLDGRSLESGQRVALPDLFELALGDDVLGLRGRQLRHARLPDAEPAIGLEGRHPIEALVLERMGDGADHLYLLLVRQAVLGSADEAAVRIAAPGVAARHARLYVSHGALWVSQLGPEPVAAGGTVLGPGNATRVDPGSEVHLGGARLRVREAGPEEFEPPAPAR